MRLGVGFGVALRRARQLATDPVLRRWLAGRAMGRHGGPPAFTAHRPPYLAQVAPLAAEAPAPPAPFAGLDGAPPGGAIELPLAGQTVRLEPGAEAALFERPFDDREDLLALHRFAWLPILGEAADGAWVGALWRAWRERHGVPDGSWAWHPYTAAERAANLLAWGRRHGLLQPLAETMAGLAAHGPAIARRLEYFGEHHTSNHLANNGRGLYLLGLELGLEACADMGERILLAEAERLFGASGILREGSSHYHLLLAKQYAEAWLAAVDHQRPAAPALRAILARALAVVPRLVLPGGLALVGDISPDCPPEHLDGLAGGRGGWLAGLDGKAAAGFTELRDGTAPVAADALAADGWLRADFAPWSGLWHAAPGGWSPMPGHGHQDVGGFELHFGTEPVIVDAGRGAYGESPEAAFYAGGRAHNTVLIDGVDPYPPNRPYYDDAWRRRMGGAAPALERRAAGIDLVHHGFARLGGVGGLRRAWRFAGEGVHITDRLDGTARRTVSRILHTVLDPEQTSEGVVLKGKTRSFRIRAEGQLRVRPGHRWTAYGRAVAATALVWKCRVALPWDGTMHIEAA